MTNMHVPKSPRNVITSINETASVSADDLGQCRNPDKTRMRQQLVCITKIDSESMVTSYI